MMIRFIIMIGLMLNGINVAIGQESQNKGFDVELQYRMPMSANHLGINAGYHFNEKHSIRYGVYYIVQDGVYWDNNHILVRTFRPASLYQHFGWSLGYYYRVLSFKNKSNISIGLDVQQNRSQSYSRSVVPYLGAGVFVETEIDYWVSLMESHIVLRCEFPLDKRWSFVFQGGGGALFQPLLSPPINLANQFVPFWAPHFQGLSYHLTFGINYSLNNSK
jgi:hypothetical protein